MDFQNLKFWRIPQPWATFHYTKPTSPNRRKALVSSAKVWSDDIPHAQNRPKLNFADDDECLRATVHG